MACCRSKSCWAFQRHFGVGFLIVTLATSFLASGCKSRDQSVGSVPPPLLPEPGDQVGSTVPRSDAILVGDTIELFVEEDPRFNGRYPVRERGDIIISGVGRIPLAGLSVSGAEQRVKALLEDGQLTQATVILDRVGRAPGPETEGAIPGLVGGPSSKILIYMTGKVNRPGQHVLTLPEGRPLGVYEAILITGGLSRFGDSRKVHLLRMESDRKRHRIPVDIKAIEEGRIVDPPIGQGDVVVVPEKVFGF